MTPAGKPPDAPTQESKGERRLQSRKFWIVAVTGICVLVLGVVGALDWRFIVEQWRYIVLGYLGVQGVTDLAGRWTGRW